MMALDINTRKDELSMTQTMLYRLEHERQSMLLYGRLLAPDDETYKKIYNEVDQYIKEQKRLIEKGEMSDIMDSKYNKENHYGFLTPEKEVVAIPIGDTLNRDVITQLKPKHSIPLKVKYHADITPLKKINKGDWIDLRCAEDISINAGEYIAISLGISVQLPEGYEMILRPRSSTFKNWGIIMVCSGVIDESFCGDNDVITFGVYATRDTHINKNDRIAQFRLFSHMPKLDIQTVETLGNPDRGGIGSTGIK